jgi:hypothetical protein
MLFKKKKEELNDQFAVFQERGLPRFASIGSISVEGFEGEGLLKNVGLSGCCLESVTYVAVEPNRVYQATIKPSADINMKPFNLGLVVKWTKSCETFFEAGFSVEGGKKNPFLDRYVKQLRVRGVQPDK